MYAPAYLSAKAHRKDTCNETDTCYAKCCGQHLEDGYVAVLNEGGHKQTDENNDYSGYHKPRRCKLHHRLRMALVASTIDSAQLFVGFSLQICKAKASIMTIIIYNLRT